MAVNLKGRHLLTLKDYEKDEILYLIDLAARLKQKKQDGIFDKKLANKNIALIFEKPSTRTRCAFTVACADEGAHPEYLGKNDLQLGHKESVEDTARVLGRMFDGIEFRGFSQDTVEKLARYSGVPVWNGLTDQDHPTQVLADFLTIKEHLGRLEGVNLVYVGDGRNNMANALMIGSSKLNVNFTIASPKQLWPDENFTAECKDFATAKSSIIITDDLQNAVKGADIIYTDVWCSMGEEDKAASRIELLKSFQVNKELMHLTENERTLFMHCLPAVKGNEVTEDVFESDASICFDEAENRMHTIKAVMVASLCD